MSELLAIKSGSEYLRFTASDFELCPLNKASVFPLARAEEAKKRCREVRETGIAAVLVKLTIIERPYTEEAEEST
jgi:hypothetical protein